MTPGPVPVPPDVLEALAQPILHHRTPEFEQILERVLQRLPTVFATQERAYIHASTGSGAMESAIVNVLSPGDTVIAVCAGKFGERWAEMASIFGMQVVRIEVPWGRDLDLGQFEQVLARHPQAKAVLCQACETSTGAWLPVRDIALRLRDQPTLMMVDAITALGAVFMPMDEWGLDVVIGGSQKALMLPTGLSFIAFSQKAWPQVESARSPRAYWDIREERKANEKKQTYFSSAVSLIRALDVILQHFAERGLKSYQERTLRLASATRAGAQVLGLSLFPQIPSPSLSCLALPPGIDGQKLRLEMERNHGITIMGGQDQLTGKVIRIGHMGAIENDDVMATLTALGQELKASKQSIEKALSACRLELGL